MSTSFRPLFILGLLGCCGLIAGAYYLQYVVGLEPCPLCYVQRIEVFTLGLIFFIAALHNPAALGRKLYAAGTLVVSALGMATAGRQMWLQTLPADELPACLPSMDYMIQAFPLIDVINKTLHGTADCAKIDWTFFGFNLAQLSFFSFCLIALFSLLLILRKA
ncbi:disulfide bond formation protein DsbB [Thiopseudomonas alkaliphila]|uniref:Disulfide bond formation protein B n=1 Tax=Thiopseudomonas alkaliphila TaxID=1697053 RepID=A0A0K1XEW5_9GAMM|nr:disulfide bond formation protein B [Thiopseudomonas alkaliphila]AKX45512.1 disulfide bond formation protein DsbB [Thiopseudomonas alkaliphila]AKX46953.1 disulfide bond formation protein DsbB [Thiopseudomonas alkaliphila]AKX48814.1 disulfide bond formation protein DsbB [Thiopseudomonas alkaliphila]AKX50814.1 disulfide bond formation protein DsbB [Thiopseudomonas alkaliphila]AKX53936.1 disulfide bond formation protein DsbB [Thiopseudomonas alkaliphila]